MGWLILILFIGYMAMATITTKRYYWRRHGVVPTPDATGLFFAGQIGFAWPVTIFLASVQNPPPCMHLGHHPWRAPVRYTPAAPRRPGDERPMRDLDELFPDTAAAGREGASPPRPRGERPMRALDELFPDTPSLGRMSPSPPRPRGERPMRDLDELFPGTPSGQEESPARAALRGDGADIEAMEAWLTALKERRSGSSNRLTDELLAKVGPPPLPPKYGTPSTWFVYEYTMARVFASEMSQRYSVESWLSFSEAEKANDPEGMERAEKAAYFWKSVAIWFDNL
jgi:hypothetical protein